MPTISSRPDSEFGLLLGSDPDAHTAPRVMIPKQQPGKHDKQGHGRKMQILQGMRYASARS